MRLREKIGYGLGDTASSMLWKLFSVYLMFFYTDICGIDAWVVGVLFLVTRIWDSLLDPVVGLLCDRTSSRWGTFRPWLLWGALPFGALGVLTFYMPEWGAGGKVVYATVTYSLMMIVYSSVNVPYAALLGVMSADPHERTVLAAFRMTFAAAGSMAVVLAVEALVKAFRPWAGPSGSWTAAVAVVAGVAVVLFFVTFSTTRERVRPVRTERHPVLVSLRDLLHNRPWLILAGAAVCLQVFNAFRESGTIYFFKYCVAGETVGTVSFAGVALTGSALFLAVGQLFNIAGIVLIPFAADRFGRRRTLVGALLLTAVFSFAFYFVRQGGYSVLLLAQALISLSVGGVLPLLWAMSADTADYAERRSGRRDTGLIFSSYSMAQKMGWAVGSAATAWILSLAGFEANAVQSPAALTVIGYLQSVFPALAALGTCAFILFYPLADARPK
ncbi:MFS transporter [uncultured Alistipes sp.]|uniref:MFS transporter n=1 Tax=uncultured Alistipes sp. TaxID=538949 RepID=UPI00259A1714|nr:MFS transporter [uncultured Alistipes sp.]